MEADKQWWVVYIFPAEQGSTKPVRWKKVSKSPETKCTKMKGPEFDADLPESPNLTGKQEKKRGQ